LKIDAFDLKMIKLLQKNARISISDLARTLNISPNAAQNRYKKILESGILKRTFFPVFLPKYVDFKNQTYKMQLIVRAELKELSNIVNSVKELQLKNCEIECFETIGHFNIFIWVISEDAVDIQLVKDRVGSHKGVHEVKVSILQSAKDFYTEVDLEHVIGMDIYGSN
jgi:Lrp/AsnC family transcriptional regulator, leucine-responsive regulatory protein